MRRGENRRLTQLTGASITVSLRLAELEKTAKYGSDPAKRKRAADAIIRQRNAYKRTLEGCGSKPTPTTNDEFDRFKFAVERLASSKDPDIRAMALAATGHNVLSLKMISRTHPFSDVGKKAREELKAMDRPDTHDENGLVQFIDPDRALRKHTR